MNLYKRSHMLLWDKSDGIVNALSKVYHINVGKLQEKVISVFRYLYHADEFRNAWEYLYYEYVCLCVLTSTKLHCEIIIYD